DRVFDLTEVEMMARLVEHVVQRGWPPQFAMGYDEFWRLFERLSWVAARVLGQNYKLLPNFWVQYVPAGQTGQGWGPHRDRTSVNLKDGLPDALNLWIALTDATTVNGSIYALPIQHDPNFPNDLAAAHVPYLEQVRALPAQAGSVLFWN